MRAQTPGGSNCCSVVEHGVDQTGGCAQSLGKFVQVANEVARLIDHMDQVHADQPLDRVGDRQVELLGEMVGQRATRRQHFVEAGTIAVIGIDGPRPQRSPSALVVFGPIAVTSADDGGVLGRLRGAVERQGLVGIRPVVVGHIVRSTGVRRRFHHNRFGGGLFPLQQRIALQLQFDERTQFEIGKLQQTNGLLQLGRHYQLLALSQLQLWRKHHYGPDRG